MAKIKMERVIIMLSNKQKLLTTVLFVLSIHLSLCVVVKADILCPSEKHGVSLKKKSGVEFFYGAPKDGTQLAPSDETQEYSFYKFVPGKEPDIVNLLCYYVDGSEIKISLPPETESCRITSHGVDCK